LVIFFRFCIGINCTVAVPMSMIRAVGMSMIVSMIRAVGMAMGVGVVRGMIVGMMGCIPDRRQPEFAQFTVHLHLP
jgi:hypothetical protein